MNEIRILLLLALSALTFFTGCSTGPFQAKEQICAPGYDKSYALETAENVLSKMNFTIAKSDIEQGIIQSHPLRAAQSFEFWRKDNIGQFNTAEANLHTIRRTAQLTASEKGQQICMVCNVRVQRMSLPEKPIISQSQTSAMFTKSGASQQRLKLNPEQKENMTWIDLGRDIRLETEILKRIEKKLTRR